jgi:hypothetical protein
MRGWVGLALFAAACSQSADERGPATGAILAAKKLGHAMPSASIVDQTWHHFERSGHERWGIRLPCGRVKFHGLGQP